MLGSHDVLESFTSEFILRVLHHTLFQVIPVLLTRKATMMKLGRCDTL